MRTAAWFVLIVAFSSGCGREDVFLLDASTCDDLMDCSSDADAAEVTMGDADDAADADATEVTTDADNHADAAEVAPIDDGSTDVATPTDASDGPRVEDATEAQATDAPEDADVGACPVECNGGCGPNGTTCMITISSVRAAPVNCPPGLACRVHCVGNQVCPSAINCAAGQPCSVVCDGDEACTSNTINQGGATSLCVECLPRGTSPGCNSSRCLGTCTIHCVGSCGTSCANCTSVASCP
jgi:hypothetical protein